MCWKDSGLSTKAVAGCITVSVIGGILGIIALAGIIDGYHTVKEGYVGVYYKFGALQDAITDPGVHFRQAFVTTTSSVLIRPEEKNMPSVEVVTKDGIEINFNGIGVLSKTKKEKNMPSVEVVTKDGIEINFNGIGVLSKTKKEKVIPMIRKYGMGFKDVLIYDRIRENLRIFCAGKTIDEVYNEQFLDIVEAVKIDVEKHIAELGENGVQVLNLVISKPDIPQDIAQNYKQVKVQWTEQLVAKQQKVTEEIKKETELLRAVADAQRQKEVLEISIQKQIIETEGQKNISEINNQIVRDKQNNLADIAKYAKDKEAAGNQALFSPQYVKLQVAQSLVNNTKFFFSGQDSVLGGLLTKILAS